MIHIVSGHLRQQFQPEIDAMHRLRARVFSDRLGWEVQVEDGREVDTFDRADPVYLLAMDDETGSLKGSSRLLPTTGPNMLRDVFPQLLPGEHVESATIWESSRFALDTDEEHTRKGALSRTTSELLCGMVELGMHVGLTQIVSVFDARMARVFRAVNCRADLIGVPCRIGRVMAYAALFEISETMWNNLASAAGITGRVVASIDGVAQGASLAA